MDDIDLAFLSRQLDRVLDRIGGVEEQIVVLTGITRRLDGAVEGLTIEMRGMYALLNRLAERVRKLEDTPAE